MDRAGEIPADASLFQAIPIIIELQYVLVRGSDRKITGIVTTSDLSGEFRRLAEPYLLLGEIENQLRRMIGTRFSLPELAEARDPLDTRDVKSVADLNFGRYILLLETPDRLNRLKVSIDRGTFVADLHHVREIRNDIMHFDPDPLPDNEIAFLRKFVRFLQVLRSQGVI